MGKLAVVHLPDLVGTSNATTCTVTGVPAALACAALTRLPIPVQDGSVYKTGTAVLSGTSWTIYPDAQFSAWVASGGKHLLTPVFVYRTS